MDALALLARAEAAGYRIELRAGELIVRGPRSGSADLLAELRAAKPTLLVALKAAATEDAAAADLYRRSVPFTTAEIAATCYCCGGTRHWRLRDGCPWVCARCHPSGRPAAELEWKGGAPARSFPLVTPPDPSTPVASRESEEVPRG